MFDHNKEEALLMAQTGPLNGQWYAIKTGILLGRDNTCDIVISDRQVSRQHARISSTQDGYVLEDLKSKNGTHHNGNRIEKQVVLQEGDLIQIALAQSFVFISSDATLPLESTNFQSEFKKASHPVTSMSISGELFIDKKSRRVWIRMENLQGELTNIEVLPPLSASQYRLLEILSDNQGQVITRYDLISTIWGENQALEISMQALDALVRRLRDRLSSVNPDFNYLTTVRGHGLRFDNPKPIHT